MSTDAEDIKIGDYVQYQGGVWRVSSIYPGERLLALVLMSDGKEQGWLRADRNDVQRVEQVR